MVLNIALIGFGKMGHELAALAKQKGVNVKSTIDPAAPDAMFRQIDAKSLDGVDVCIDFSNPAAVVENVKKCAALKKNIVMATTGWGDKLGEVKSIVQKEGIGFIFASNFSIGVNLFFRMVANAASLAAKVPDYDAFGYELHHNRKLDSPSGTAKSLAEIVLKNMPRKTKAVFDKLDRKIAPEEFHLASVRAGDIPGTHVIGFDSSADTIELKHAARNRQGFALGALMAAEWLKGKKGFFSIDDFMDSIIGKK